MLTAEELRALLAYCPVTDRLFWRKNGKEALNVPSPNGYRYVTIKRKSYLFHRVIWALWYGKWPDGNIDHEDHNPLNNSISNLRDTTQMGNLQNASKSILNRSGATGVILFKRTGRWMAYITVNYKRVHLGYFKDFNDAVVARLKAQELYGFHENHGA